MGIRKCNRALLYTKPRPSACPARRDLVQFPYRMRPRSSVDRALASGARRVGSSPAGGTPPSFRAIFPFLAAVRRAAAYAERAGMFAGAGEIQRKGANGGKTENGGRRDNPPFQPNAGAPYSVDSAPAGRRIVSNGLSAVISRPPRRPSTSRRAAAYVGWSSVQSGWRRMRIRLRAACSYT